ncbi:hypothetical protein [Infirmifilum sp. NZ]|uniref:hypothetical protein n=1 Tax=Infirmifilum sp. NZ TaxID=2926850 RepID=UPI00279DDD2E|nr:hypothetical protein [Infirmifilum sp. NZ]UNQ73209.1 hypothetical protein MOV14_08870 [Infirmifilum sp. NZ]
MVPMLNVLFISVTAGDSYITGKIVYVGLDNFVKAITQYSSAVKNSTILTLVAATVDLIIGYPLAYLLARKKIYFENIIRALMVFPYFGDLYISYGVMEHVPPWRTIRYLLQYVRSNI